MSLFNSQKEREDIIGMKLHSNGDISAITKDTGFKQYYKLSKGDSK